MKMKHLLLASVMTSALSCQSPRDVRHDAFDDYPVCEGKWEEMRYSPAATEFALWAPTAQQVRVLLYEEATGGVAYKMVDMQPATQGMWKATVEGDLKHTYYVFNVKIDDVWQGDTPGVMAKAVGVNGLRAAVIDLETTNPQGWDQDRRPAFKRKADAVIYEMHYRDFSMDSVSGMAHKGKYLALTERGTCMATGERTGVDHLLELGVTHVHVQPSADFSSVDESDLSRPQYNWGYDPLNYNVPEGSYATDPFPPGGADKGVQGDGAGPAPCRIAGSDGCGLQSYGTNPRQQLRAYSAGLFLPQERKRRILERFGLRQRNGQRAGHGAQVYGGITALLGGRVPHRRIPFRPDGDSRPQDDAGHQR